MVEFIGQPVDATAVGEHARSRLADSGWQGFRAAVAFVKLSGVRHPRNDNDRTRRQTAGCQRRQIRARLRPG